jgi:hypothetical protein
MLTMANGRMAMHKLTYMDFTYLVFDVGKTLLIVLGVEELHVFRKGGLAAFFRDMAILA